jgi:hypothetical protein
MKQLPINTKQSLVLLEFLQNHVKTWTVAKICNTLGIRKAYFENIRFTDKTKSGNHWGDYILIYTEDLNGYFYQNTNYPLIMYLYKDDKDDYFLSKEVFTPTRYGLIKLPKKVIKALNTV